MKKLTRCRVVPTISARCTDSFKASVSRPKTLWGASGVSYRMGIAKNEVKPVRRTKPESWDGHLVPATIRFTKLPLLLLARETVVPLVRSGLPQEV